jgi:hypothetical protein
MFGIAAESVIALMQHKLLITLGYAFLTEVGVQINASIV